LPFGVVAGVGLPFGVVAGVGTVVVVVVGGGGATATDKVMVVPTLTRPLGVAARTVPAVSFDWV
jgi:hypothetical protein